MTREKPGGVDSTPIPAEIGLSLLCSFACNLQKYSNIDDGARCYSPWASCNIYAFFHFVFQEELIASKVIPPFAMCKIDFEGKLLVYDFLKIYENSAGRLYLREVSEV